MSHTPLLIRPKFFPNESVASYLLRAAEMNGRKNARSLCVRALQTSNFSLSGTNNRKLKVLFEALGVANIYSENLKDRRNHAYSIRNVEIPLAIRRPELSAFCPECLTEGAYWRDLWQTKLYQVCTKHNLLMVTNCPQCQKQLTSSRGHLLKCGHCEFDLRNSQKISASPYFSKLIEEHLNQKKPMWVLSERFKKMENLQISESDKANFIWLYSMENEQKNASHFLAERIINTAHLLHPRIQMMGFNQKKDGDFIREIFSIVDPLIAQMDFPVSCFRDLTRPALTNVLNCSLSVHTRILAAAGITLPVKRGIFYIQAQDLKMLFSKGYFDQEGMFNFYDGSPEQHRREYLLSEVAKMTNRNGRDLTNAVRRKFFPAERKLVGGKLRWVVQFLELKHYQSPEVQLQLPLGKKLVRRVGPLSMTLKGDSAQPKN